MYAHRLAVLLLLSPLTICLGCNREHESNTASHRVTKQASYGAIRAQSDADVDMLEEQIDASSVDSDRHVDVDEPSLAALDEPSIARASSEDGDSKAPTTTEFSKAQLDFLTREFSEQVRDMSPILGEGSKTGGKINVRRMKTTRILGEHEEVVAIWGNGKRGYVPGIDFSTHYDEEYHDDFDRDGRQEIIFAIDETGGGTHAWTRLFSLGEKRDGSLQLRHLKVPCPCTPKLRCRLSPHPELIGTSKKLLIVRSVCLREDDAECCPAITREVSYAYRQGKLLKKAILRDSNNF